MEEALKFIYNKGSRPIDYAVTVRNLGMCQWEEYCVHIGTKIKTLVTMWFPEGIPHLQLPAPYLARSSHSL